MRKSMIMATLLVFGFSILSFSCARKNPDRLTTELLPVTDSPLVGFRILLHFGSAHDPEGQEGIGALMLSMLAVGGSRTMSYQEITQAFYPMAAGVGLQMDKEMAAVTGASGSAESGVVGMTARAGAGAHRVIVKYID